MKTKVKIIKRTKARCHVTFALNSGKDSISFSVASKTVFQRIGLLLEIAKFVNFIADLGIVQLPLFLELAG